MPERRGQDESRSESLVSPRACLQKHADGQYTEKKEKTRYNNEEFDPGSG